MRVLALLILLAISIPSYSCEEDTSFGCKPWVDCMPIADGWKWIKNEP